MLRLERDLIIEVMAEAASRILTTRALTIASTIRATTSRTIARTFASRAVAKADERRRKALHNHLSTVPIIPILILPLARLQLTADVDAIALVHVLLDDLDQPVAPHNYAMPLGTFFLLAGIFVLPLLRGSDAEIGDERAARTHAPDLRISTEIADEDDKVF